MAVRALQHPARQRLSVLLHFITGTNMVNTSRLLWKETRVRELKYKPHRRLMSGKIMANMQYIAPITSQISQKHLWYGSGTARGAQSQTISLNLLVNSHNYVLYLCESTNNNEIYLQVVKMCLSHTPKICQLIQGQDCGKCENQTATKLRQCNMDRLIKLSWF